MNNDFNALKFAPIAVQNYAASIPNSVRALYGTFKKTSFPWNTKEERIQAWGQLSYDSSAARVIAYHMWNNGMRKGWRYISWRCEIDTPLVPGAKKNGLAPDNFSIANYVPLTDKEREEIDPPTPSTDAKG